MSYLSVVFLSVLFLLSGCKEYNQKESDNTSGKSVAKEEKTDTVVQIPEETDMMKFILLPMNTDLHQWAGRKVVLNGSLEEGQTAPNGNSLIFNVDKNLIPKGKQVLLSFANEASAQAVLSRYRERSLQILGLLEKIGTEQGNTQGIKSENPYEFNVIVEGIQ